MNAAGKQKQSPWVSDQGDGTYRNPVLHADYSDPDVIRVGDDFYMTASSFSHFPGLPILHSRDLVNWTLINHAVQKMDLPGFDRPQHGNGIWAPSIRCHAGKYWIFYGDPDVGIFMTTAKHPGEEWTKPLLMQEGKGLIDPCPLWDEDGKAYLVHAFANSRSGIKHVLRLCEMAADGSRLLGEGRIVFDGTENHPTMEGPKMYKRNGYYYIFAPAGGVRTGWQTVLRSSSPYGPYEDKVVLHQGDSDVNGPHQGGWVELESGESWFLHFQDKEAYGRIVHLQPVSWVEDWPMMGEDRNGDGIGEPVNRYRKPNVEVGASPACPETTDEFDGMALGLQWQWQANPVESWYTPGMRASHLRLHAWPVPPESGKSLYAVPQLLMQKFPAEAFDASVKLSCCSLSARDKAGLVIFGFKHASFYVTRDEQGELALGYSEGDESAESVLWHNRIGLEEGEVWLSVSIRSGAMCEFSYSVNGESFQPIGERPFAATESRWVGAKVGIFAIHEGREERGGYADFDWFRVTEPKQVEKVSLEAGGRQA
ncbi:glycoside hydrolase family 43 protein [Paenibacillus harenae]|uniref:Beta-xylosidase n=1 Tax=Paenibacillus harenae TaxID=306543 RepID=A0ABT9TW82_PAEHA|nr:glycoside hydrolase 43 family protein [Paenibacillus harenae]MDQ0110695.1 beta-xylosidase [Paenibacillus harenae]